LIAALGGTDPRPASKVSVVSLSRTLALAPDAPHFTPLLD
jgi:hypothetical protein